MNGPLGRIMRKPDYDAYTDMEVHAELCFAEVLLLKVSMEKIHLLRIGWTKVCTLGVCERFTMMEIFSCKLEFAVNKMCQ